MTDCNSEIRDLEKAHVWHTHIWQKYLSIFFIIHVVHTFEV